METKIVEVVSQSLSVTMGEEEWRAVLVEPNKFLKALRSELAGMARARIGTIHGSFTWGARHAQKGHGDAGTRRGR